MDRIPVSIVTGFLGSGKTTFIRRVLQDPAFGRTAVIVNEFGEISIDHDLIASSDDTVLTLSTGCLCCAVQTDLARTLAELSSRRREGKADYDRVLIETSGLANPGPMVQSLLTDRAVAAEHRLDTILTLVDATRAEDCLQIHEQARNQIAVADAILISKLDLQPLGPRAGEQLRRLNPMARTIPVTDVSAATLFGRDAIERTIAETPPVVSHMPEIESFVLVRSAPLPALALTLFLEALAEHCGARLLRLKGLVGLEEMPNRPAAIHGVHHVVSPPEFLERWPSEDTSTRVVFITTGIPRYFPARLLNAVEHEVREAVGRA